jgi:hypothetical protein
MEGPYAEVYARREAVSRWLKGSVVHEVRDERDAHEQRLAQQSRQSESAASVFTLLTGHQINEACEEAGNLVTC